MISMEVSNIEKEVLKMMNEGMYLIKVKGSETEALSRDGDHAYGLVKSGTIERLFDADFIRFINPGRYLLTEKGRSWK